MMKRCALVLGCVLSLSASMSAQDRFAPPKVSSLPSACNVGDIVNLTTGTVGDYVCKSANTWAIITSGSATPQAPITCADTGVVFASAANTVGCDITKLSFNDATNSLATANLALTGLTWSAASQQLIFDGGGFGAAELVSPNVTGTDTASAISIHPGTAADGFGADLVLQGSSVTSHGGAGLTLGTGTASNGGQATLAGGTIGLSADAIHFSENLTSTSLWQLFDLDALAWKTFATLTGGVNAPSLVIAPPAAGGGTVSFQGTYKANDGTSGFTGTCTIAGLTSIVVKNGLIVSCS